MKQLQKTLKSILIILLSFLLPIYSFYLGMELVSSSDFIYNVVGGTLLLFSLYWGVVFVNTMIEQFSNGE